MYPSHFAATSGSNLRYLQAGWRTNQAKVNFPVTDTGIWSEQMTKKDRQQDQVEHVSGGGHLGGTRFGQQPGDAKVTPRPKPSGKDDDIKKRNEEAS